MSYRVLITEFTRGQIIEQARYIAENSQAITVAERWLEEVYDAADTLADFPRRCVLAPENELRGYEIRRLLIGKHLLLFTIFEEDQTVIAIGFRHGSRLPRPDELPAEKPENPTF